MATNNESNNTVQENDFSVNRSLAGTAVESSVEHSDNTNAASHARLLAQTGGGSGGDPFILMSVSGVTSYSFGIDNTDDNLVITDSTSPSAGNDLWSMTSSGERTLPLQSAFYAYLSGSPTNVTGDLTTYTIAFDSEIFDQNGDFNTGTYTFTAPVTGRYYLSTTHSSDNYNAAAYTQTTGFIETSNHSVIIYTYTGASYESISGTGLYRFSGSTITDMDAADTAYVTITVGNAAKTIRVLGTTNYTNFTGALIC